MRFMLMLCGDEAAGARAKEMPVCDEWSKELADRGMLVDQLGLHPPADAATVRVREGEVLLSDGPFAETKEQMGGVAIIECADRDEALRVAATHPWAEIGLIEVRQVLG